MRKANVKRICTLLGFLIAIWLAGFALFVYRIQQHRFSCICTAEVIVVLTGGQDRIFAGGQLLAEDKEKLLLLSGTGKGFAKQNFFTALPANSAVRQVNAETLFLGTYAKNTIENAYEALAFMKMHNKHSLCLVTSDYHMPRSLLLFQGVLSQYSIVPCALNTAQNLNLWQFGRMALLEYTKYTYYIMQNLWLIAQ